MNTGTFFRWGRVGDTTWRQWKKAKRAPWGGASHKPADPEVSRRLKSPIRQLLIRTAKVSVALPLGATALPLLPQLTAVALWA